MQIIQILMTTIVSLGKLEIVHILIVAILKYEKPGNLF